MASQRFLIGAPFSTGLQKNVRPWLTMNDAFTSLENMYVWEDSVKKRVGSKVMNESVSDIQKELFTRLRMQVGTTDAVTGNLAPTVMPGTTPGKIGEMFSVGDIKFNVTLLNGATLTTDPSITATYNTATKTVAITGNGINNLNTSVYWYPSLPVMHFDLYEEAATNDERIVAFDTQFSYTYTYANGWNILGPLPPAAGSGLWTDPTGDAANFHSSANWRGTQSYDYNLFVVNGVAADEVQYFDGTKWTKFKPKYDSGANDDIVTAKFVIPFNDYLLLKNTTEVTGTNNVFRNRTRYSQNGSPFNADNAWRQDIAGKGGYIEAPTKEALTATGPIKNRLIDYFERQTFELQYTNNEVLPFLFQQINSLLGVESGNSLIVFDREIIGFGSRGLHSCNGINIQRIDTNIPREMFEVQNKLNGPERVCSIIDYEAQLAYWSYPSTERSFTFTETFPNKMLVYNYRNDSFSKWDDSITAFGYYQIEQDRILADIAEPWEELESNWLSGQDQAKAFNVIAGNQQGFTFLMDYRNNALSRSLSINDIAINDEEITLVIIDHNLKIGDFILIEGCLGTTGLNGLIFKIDNIDNSDRIIILAPNVATAYTGGGTVEFIPKPFLRTKEFNFYSESNLQTFISEANFNFDKTTNGQVNVGILRSFSDETLDDDQEVMLGNFIISTAPNPIVIGNNEAQSRQLWRRLFPSVEGSTVQLQLTISDELMLNKNVVRSDLTLNGIVLTASPTGPL